MGERVSGAVDAHTSGTLPALAATRWTVVFAVGTVAFWVVGIGAGWRAWLLLDQEDSGRGLVAHAQAFGVDASI